MPECAARYDGICNSSILPWGETDNPCPSFFCACLDLVGAAPTTRKGRRDLRRLRGSSERTPSEETKEQEDVR